MSTRRLLLFAAVSTFALATPAKAVPIFFEGNLGVGFNPAHPDVVALGVNLVVNPSWVFVSAGNPALNPLLSVTTALLGQPTVPASVSAATPILAAVRYTVTNTTGSVLSGSRLVFTLGAVSGWPALTPNELGIDVPGMVIVQTPTCVGNAVGPCAFGAVLLPFMNPGAVHTFDIAHVIKDTIAPSTVIPTPGLALLVRVPEPSVALLVLLPAALLLRRRR